MTNEILDQKCPSCRSQLRYNPKSDGLDCSYCGKHFSVQDLQKIKEQKEQLQQTKRNYDGYTCKNCGAKIIASSNTSATFCVYCGSTAIIKERITNEYTPTSIIPFKVTKEEAIDLFLAVKKMHILSPFGFFSKKNISEIQGIYIPFWLSDFRIQGKISGTGKKITSWWEGNTKHTTTDIFDYDKEGKFIFFDIPIDGSRYLEDALMNTIEPFDYKELVPFDEAYLSGFLAEKYDLAKEEAAKDAIARATNTIVKELETSLKYKKTNTINKEIHPTTTNSDYVLLPIWLFHIKYHGKVYYYVVNGQTKKISGNSPIQKLKLIFLFLVLFGLFAFIITTLFGGIHHNIFTYASFIVSFILSFLVSRFVLKSYQEIHLIQDANTYLIASIISDKTGSERLKKTHTRSIGI